jgi:hypothetical protein
MTDPRAARRLALFLSAGLLVALACTCTNPLAGLSGGSAGGAIGDYVWLDANGDGNQDTEEQGIAGVEVRLLDENGDEVDTTVTDKDGAYSFSGPEAGTYVVAFVPPEGMHFTLQDQGLDDSLDSDARQEDGRTEPFGYDGSEDMTRDAGLVAEALATTVPPPKATPTATAAATATEASADTPQVDVTYHHTVPGQFSEIIILISNLEPGQEVSGQVTGPAVDGDGTFTAFGGADGTCEIRVKIFQFGVYDVDIPDLGPSQAVNVTADEPPGN